MRERWRIQAEVEDLRSGLSKIVSRNGSFAYIYDEDGSLFEAEYYEPTGEYCNKLPLVNVRVENAEGDLIAKHETRRISDDAYDIHVTDRAGNLQVILHHSDVSKGEPYTIREEWFV
tara:strand:- start:352 stop:702 length:351 start_codon:yes stop_codon:yes gene_type:complete